MVSSPGRGDGAPEQDRTREAFDNDHPSLKHRRILESPQICRVIFDKMQGGLAQLIAESSLRRRALEEPLPKAKSREKASGIAGKSRVAKGPDQG